MKLISEGYSLFAKKEYLYFIDKNKYFMYDGMITEIKENEYFYCKFGENYNKIQKQLEFGINEYSVYNDLKSGVVIVSDFREDMLKIFSKFGDEVFELDKNAIPFSGIYDAIFLDDNIWMAYPTCNIVVCYSPKRREIIKSYDESFGISFPESIWINNGNIYISNMGNKNVLKIDLDGAIYEYMKFSEPVWEFAITDKREYVRLQSGIYEI